jgi:AraC-like DNA-binding protein
MGAIPVYRDDSGEHQADRCAPLAAAAAKGAVWLQALVHGHYPGRRLPAQALPGLKSVGYWDADRDQDWGLPWHRNEGIEIMFIARGAVGFAVDDREYRLQRDCLTVTRPWQPHRVGSPTVAAGRLCWMILDVGVRRPNQVWTWPSWVLLGERDKQELWVRLQDRAGSVLKATPEIRRCFLAISENLHRSSLDHAISELSLVVNELLLALLKLLRSHPGQPPCSCDDSLEAVEVFLDRLRNERAWAERQWRLQEMARECRLGVTQFTAHVRRLTGLTPERFLMECRLQHAATLLREQPDLSVLEVALACGFSSSQHFATLFRRRFGSTPTALRRGAPTTSVHPSRLAMPPERPRLGSIERCCVGQES